MNHPGLGAAPARAPCCMCKLYVQVVAAIAALQLLHRSYRTASLYMQLSIRIKLISVRIFSVVATTRTGTDEFVRRNICMGNNRAAMHNLTPAMHIKSVNTIRGPVERHWLELCLAG